MNQKIIFPALLFLASIYHCQKPDPLSNSQSKDISLSFVFVHDLSKTYQHIDAPGANLLRNLAEHIAVTGGIIAFGLIGAPDSTGRLVRQRFIPAPVQPTNPTYSDNIKFQEKADSIKLNNNMLIDSFVNNCLSRLKQYPLQDHTDLNGSFRQANAFFNEPGMEAFTPVFFIHSDGIQDVVMPPLFLDTILQPNLIAPRIKVLTCGWKHREYLKTWTPVESLEALPSVVEFFISKQK